MDVNAIDVMPKAKANSCKQEQTHHRDRGGALRTETTSNSKRIELDSVRIVKYTSHRVLNYACLPLRLPVQLCCGCDACVHVTSIGKKDQASSYFERCDVDYKLNMYPMSVKTQPVL